LLKGTLVLAFIAKKIMDMECKDSTSLNSVSQSNQKPKTGEKKGTIDLHNLMNHIKGKETGHSPAKNWTQPPVKKYKE
jgi:hypothetical protein